MQNEGELLVIKGGASKNNPDIGSVRILFATSSSADEKEIPFTPDEGEFPTAGVWISKGYEQIEDRFKDGELFRLTQWNLQDNDRLEGIDGISADFHRHWALGSSAKPIDHSLCLPIISASLPDESTGVLEHKIINHNKPFFCQSERKLFGPLKVVESLDEGTVKVESHSILGLSNHHVYEIDLSSAENCHVVLKNEHDGVGGKYLWSCKSLQLLPRESLREKDFISDEQLISFYAKGKFGKRNLLKKREAESLRQSIAESVKQNRVAMSPRTERIQNILTKYLDNSHEVGASIVEDFLSGSEGKSFLSVYLDKRQHLLEKFGNPEGKKISADNEKLVEEKVKLEREVKQYKEQVLAQKSRVEQEKLEVAKMIEDERQSAQKEIEKIKSTSKKDLERAQQEILGQIQTEYIEANEELQSIREELNVAYSEIEDVSSHKELLDQRRFLEKLKRDLEKTVESQEELLHSPNLSGRIAEVRTIIDILQGRSSVHQKQDSFSFNSPKICTSLPSKGGEYIQSLVELFEESGHTISFEEMANLVICTQQSFLTILAGPPGSGKTSTVLKMAEYSGLKNEGDSNFLNVPVSRGWISSRDFIGYNNSLKGFFQPAKTGVFEFLSKVEPKDEESFLRLILLDEANLSPIEHYWSDFLALCDREGRGRPINTGMPDENSKLTVGQNIRFIATINNDDTTECLSPRLCDRVPVISMGAPCTEGATQIASSILDGAVPYKSLESWFAGGDFDTELHSLIENFINKMESADRSLGGAIRFSPRKKNAISNYYAVSRQYLSDLEAVDFALSQFALPLINGHGKGFRARLDSIYDMSVSNGLVRTGAILSTILQNGESYIDSYSFF